MRSCGQGPSGSPGPDRRCARRPRTAALQAAPWKVKELGRRVKHLEPVRESGGDQQRVAAIARQLNAVPLQERLRSRAQVNRHIEHPALQAANHLGLERGWGSGNACPRRFPRPKVVDRLACMTRRPGRSAARLSCAVDALELAAFVRAADPSAAEEARGGMSRVLHVAQAMPPHRGIHGVAPPGPAGRWPHRWRSNDRYQRRCAPVWSRVPDRGHPSWGRALPQCSDSAAASCGWGPGSARTSKARPVCGASASTTAATGSAALAAGPKFHALRPRARRRTASGRAEGSRTGARARAAKVAWRQDCAGRAVYPQRRPNQVGHQPVCGQVTAAHHVAGARGGEPGPAPVGVVAEKLRR